MPWGKGRSIKLEEFTEVELNALAADYGEIRGKVNEGVRSGFIGLEAMPDLEEPSVRLAYLRQLDAVGDLMIRISYAGNLNIWAREGAELKEERDEEGEGVGYLTVLQRKGVRPKQH